MEIRVYPECDGFSFELRTKNGRVIAAATQTYANRRNAVAAAKLIAAGEIKVIEA